MPSLLERPVYSESVSCSHSRFASPAQGYEQKELDLNQHLVTNPPTTFFFWAKGNSMVEVDIYDGSMVIVDRSISPKSFSVVVAAVEGEWMIKREFMLT